MTKTETKSTVLVKHHLKQLKLPTMHGECEKVAARSAQENLDHLAFLLALCELELVDRERRAAERRLKAAKFPAHKTLDEFDFAAQPSVNKPLVLELVKGEYLLKRENLILVGASGTGKTHLATALGMAACLSGKKVRLIVGHTDAVGSKHANQRLSERRAHAVRKYLLRHYPISPKRLIATGLGEERLADPKYPASGANRRVEVVLIEPGKDLGYYGVRDVVTYDDYDGYRRGGRYARY